MSTVFQMPTRRALQTAAKPPAPASTLRNWVCTTRTPEGRFVREVVQAQDWEDAWTRIHLRDGVPPSSVRPQDPRSIEQSEPHDVRLDSLLPMGTTATPKRQALMHTATVATAVLASAAAGYLIGDAAIQALTR